MVTKLKGFEEVDPWSLNENIFKMIGKDYLEICMGNAEEGANAMTAAWAGLGVMWNMPVAFVVVRGEEYRYSRHLMDQEPLFSVCFLGDERQDAKMYLGHTHGWDDPDKIGSAGLHEGWCGLELTHDPKKGLGTHVHTPFIEESKLVLICEKIHEQELTQDGCLDPALWEKWYTTQGQHRLYIAEIKAAFRK